MSIRLIHLCSRGEFKKNILLKKRNIFTFVTWRVHCKVKTSLSREHFFMSWTPLCPINAYGRLKVSFFICWIRWYVEFKVGKKTAPALSIYIYIYIYIYTCVSNCGFKYHNKNTRVENSACIYPTPPWPTSIFTRSKLVWIQGLLSPRLLTYSVIKPGPVI